MTLETLASLVTIILIPIGWSLPWLGECGKPYGGGYDVKTSTAYVCDNENKQVVEMEKYHEIGHHFYSLLSVKEKSEYSKLYERDKSKIFNFYREYGRTNVEESFAEDVMGIYMNIPPRQWQKQRYLLIKKFLRNHENNR